ncbi:hypothetical protein V8C35DRAFT_294995 [Trichoderma chlorosporum]
MGIKRFGRSVKEHIVTVWRRRWTWFGRNQNTAVQEDSDYSDSISSLFIIVPHNTRERDPPSNFDNHIVPEEIHTEQDEDNVEQDENHPKQEQDDKDADQASCRKLVLLSENEFSPPGTPTGTALGIPAEHLLEDHSSDMDEAVQPIPLNYDNPFATPTTTESEDSDSGHSTIREGTRTPSNRAARSNTPSVNNPLVTPSRAGSDSSDSGSTTRAVPPSSISNQSAHPSAVGSLGSSASATADVNPLRLNPVKRDLANEPQETTDESDELAGSELVHTCSLCGHKNMRRRHGSVG